MYNNGESMNKKIAMKLTDKSSTYCNRLLKGLVEKEILIWYGTSKNDPMQYYKLNF